MRVFTYICDNCGKKLSEIRDGDIHSKEREIIQDWIKAIVSPHIVLSSLDRSKSGWTRKPDNSDADSGSEWKLIAGACPQGGVLQFCNSKCLAKYFDKLLENYKINKLKE